jgi:hypothetical protein
MQVKIKASINLHSYGIHRFTQGRPVNTVNYSQKRQTGQQQHR